MKVVIACILLIFSTTAEFSADGDLDTSFSGGSRVTDLATNTNDLGREIFVQADGKIVVAASGNSRLCALRYNADGTLDTTFDTDGIAMSAFTGVGQSGALQSDGKIIVAGSVAAGSSLIRFNADGTVDTSFDGDGQVITNFGGSSPQINAVLVQPDGKILVAGRRRLPSPGDFGDIIMARYNPDGSLDTTFDGDGILISNLTASGFEEALDAVLLPDGKIVIAGLKAGVSGFWDFLVARYNSNGSVDTTFDLDGFVSTDLSSGSNDFANHVTLAPTGRIVAGGAWADPNTAQQSLAMVRYPLTVRWTRLLTAMEF